MSQVMKIVKSRNIYCHLAEYSDRPEDIFVSIELVEIEIYYE
jgi:hypothetical protein